MSTVVSIALYLAAAFFALCLGIISEKRKSGDATENDARTAVLLTSAALTFAVTLQVFA